MKKFGCIFVAFGRPYLIQALNSVQSLRKVSPSVPVCVLTNSLLEPPSAFADWDRNNDIWIYVEASDNQNRLFKTDLLRYTPFEKTLYLDCDTEVLQDVTSMFGFLCHWDIAFRLKEEGYSPQKEKGRQTVLNGKAAIFELPHWNSGVFLFKANPRVEEFFALWNKHFRAGKIQYDQVALVEAIFRSSCRILSLDARWNAGKSWGAERPNQKQYILHYMHDIDERIARQLLNLDRQIYIESTETAASSVNDTATFVRKRQHYHTLKHSRPGMVGRLVRVLRRIKLSLRTGLS